MSCICYCQGQTVSPPNALVVDIRSAWKPGMAYVTVVSITFTKKILFNLSYNYIRVFCDQRITNNQLRGI